MTRIIILVFAGAILLLGVVSIAAAQNEVTPTEAMEEGNARYEAKKFAEAAEIYQTIADAGVYNSSLYFNLGNAYMKSGDLGRAILNYRRAAYLNPRDQDIFTNLTIARLQTLDRLDGASETGVGNLIQRAEEWLTLTEAAVLALLLWLVASTLLTVAVLSRRLRRYALWGAGIFGVFLIVGLLSMTNRIYREYSSPAAVIVASSVDVTSGPGDADQYVVEFTLHTGAEVRVVDTRPGWRRVALPGNNFQGWLPAESMETVLTD
jgi:tetratricopeptide (TPR) repeat protein